MRTHFIPFSLMLWPGLLLCLLLGVLPRAHAQTYNMSNTPVTTCSGTFYDSGGASGNYANNESFTKTFSPGTAGARARLSFTSFNTEGTDFFGGPYDVMTIYDGANTSATVIGTYYGTTSPGTITATNAAGQLTVRFTSDGSTTRAGWAATISCLTTPLYAMSNTPVTSCSGTFFDPNVNGNYSNNQDFTKVLTPGTAGAAVSLTFSLFDLEVGGSGGVPYDYLSFYDGPNTSAPLIGQYSGTTSPGTITASNSTGQLTVVFHSDANATGAGWEADISCVDPVAFAPTSGSPGTSVLISGTSLTTVTSVTFNGVAAFFYINSATEIRASVPTGASSGVVRLVRSTAATSVTSGTSFTVCGTQAVAQNATANLAANNTATVAVSSVNNGSTSACGAAAVAFLNATELITNGTFDTDATGWTSANINFAGGYQSAGGNPGGMFILNDNGNVSTDPTLTQTVTGLAAGATYLLQGDYRNNDGLNASQGAPTFSVDINGTSVLTRSNPGSSWTHFSYTLTVPTGITSRTVAFRSEINGTDIDMAIDNISLRRLDNSLTYTCTNLGANAVTLAATNPNGDVSTAAATIAVAAVPPANLTTWNGNVSTDFQDCRNWSYGKVPDATTSATIPSGLTTYPTLTTSTLTVANLTIAGALTVGNGATLQVAGDFTNNGTANLNGTVAFVGSTATHNLGGTSATTFTNLTVNKIPLTTVQLARDVTVTGALTMSAGTLTTGSANKVTLGSTATIAETNTSYVSGAVETTRVLSTAGATTTFGGLGLSLTPTGASLPGSTLVRRVTDSPVTGAASRQGIGRYFTITPTTNTGLSVDMAFDYFTRELNGIAATDLTLYRGTSATTTTWARQTNSTRSGNTVSRAALTSLAGTFTLSSITAPLPVELVEFTARLRAGQTAVQLDWTTASEKNSAYFDVERSTDGMAFARLATVDAAGSSNALRAYALLDTRLPAGQPVLYYRLRQVDQDGTATYSPVRSVKLSGKVAMALALYPNPAHASATLIGATPGTAVQVFDALGRVVATANTDTDGTATLALPAGLPAGVYLVRSGTRATRLTVE